MEQRLSKMTSEQDSVVIYKMSSEKYVDKSVIGQEKGSSDRII